MESLHCYHCCYCCVIVCSPVIPFNLPDVGEAIMTVIITEWLVTHSQYSSVVMLFFLRLVKTGDTVAMGDPVCEVQSDKVIDYQRLSITIIVY